MELAALKQLRCPQNWNFEEYCDIETILQDKLDGYECPEDKTKYSAQIIRYKNNCHLSYETYRKEKYDEALKYLENCDVTDDFIKKYDKVFRHVVKASKAHILLKLGYVDQAKEIINDLTDQTYSTSEEGAFFYIEGLFAMNYGEEGMQTSLKLFRSALNIDDSEAEYNFALGSILSKIRHNSFTSSRMKPSDEEKEALCKAFNLHKDLPHYGIMLARFYMDSRHNLIYYKKKEFSHLAASVCRKILEHSKSCTGNDIARCIYLLIKIKDTSNLEMCAAEARRKTNSTIMNHYIGLYYLHEREYEECRKCFEVAVKKLPYIAGLTLLSIYRLNNDSIENLIIEEYITKWNSFYEDSSTNNILCLNICLSEFYLVVMNDIENAAKYFIKASTYKIDKIIFISLSKHTSCNYLCTLRYELSQCLKNDDSVLVAAKDVLKKLSVTNPAILREQSPKWPSRSAAELRLQLF